MRRARRVLAATLLAAVALASRPLGAAEPAPVLVSRQLLAARGLAVGDVVRLATDSTGAGAARFRIAGVYEPLPDPMRLAQPRLEVRLHLPDLLAMEDPAERGAVSAVNLVLAAPERAAEVARQISVRLPGALAVPTGDSSADALTFVVLERFHLAIALITVLGSSAFLLALMVMRADERREVAGTLRLVGFSRRRVLVHALGEGLAVAALGALFGVVLAGLTQGLVNAFFQRWYDTALVFVRVTPAIAMRAVAIAVPLGVLAGVAASWSILRRDVVEVLRR